MMKEFGLFMAFLTTWKGYTPAGSADPWLRGAVVWNS